MPAKRFNSSTPASGAAKKSSTVTLTCYLEGCDEKPDISFVAGEPGQMQVIFPAHRAKLETLPGECFLSLLNMMVSDEPFSLPPGVTADGFCNLLCVLYGKDMALSQDNWLSTFVTYAVLALTETGLEAQLLGFAKNHISPAMALTCLGICIKYQLYNSPLEDICWACVDRDGDATFKAPNFLDVQWSLLLRILERDSLRVRSEVAVYRAAVYWAMESLKRKSKTLTYGAIRKELGEAFFQIRFTQMPLENFAKGPAKTNILTDKEKADICLSRFNKDVMPQGFVLRKRVGTKEPNPSIVEECALCGHSDDAFIQCCANHIRVPAQAWSETRCLLECDGIAYRCKCGAVNLEKEHARVSECKECGVDIHYCADGVCPLAAFNKGESCIGCDEIPVSDDDADADSQSDDE